MTPVPVKLTASGELEASEDTAVRVPVREPDADGVNVITTLHDADGASVDAVQPAALVIANSELPVDMMLENVTGAALPLVRVTFTGPEALPTRAVPNAVVDAEIVDFVMDGAIANPLTICTWSISPPKNVQPVQPNTPLVL